MRNPSARRLAFVRMRFAVRSRDAMASLLIANWIAFQEPQVAHTSTSLTTQFSIHFVLFCAFLWHTPISDIVNSAGGF